MKERPILFIAPMVRALLEGRETQTRRVVKPQPEWRQDILSRGLGDPCPGVLAYKQAPGIYHCYGSNNFCDKFCPYGKAGDSLWVREKWTGTWHGPDEWGIHVHYAADGAESLTHAVPPYALPKAAAKVGSWVSPLFMPRWASRITLEITEVRVQRLQEISEEDAIAEGICDMPDPVRPRNPYRFTHISDFRGHNAVELFETAAEAYQKLWESIHGPGSWAMNPWCWAVSFKVVKP